MSSMCAFACDAHIEVRGRLTGAVNADHPPNDWFSHPSAEGGAPHSDKNIET